jgi:hypothetical protein
VSGLKVYPHRVNPLAGETIPITFTPTESAYVTVIIKDYLLDEKKRLANSALMPAGAPVTLRFDGKDSSGILGTSMISFVKGKRRFPVFTW